jgi:hypothetical protein
MNTSRKLIALKILHTTIWAFFNCVIFYLAYTVLLNKINTWTWICLGAILLEGLILLAFKRVCPITVIAQKYTKSRLPNFDIYLPGWLAKHNQQIYSILVAIIFAILIYRLLENRV